MKTINKETGTFKSFDDTPIYYEVRGQGQPIVLAYGIGCLLNHWRHQIHYFSRNYRIIAFDYRGHHRSGMPQDPVNLSIEAIAKDLKALQQHLHLESASFWGHSFGAQVLFKTYELFPEIFNSLVLINGFAKEPLRDLFGLEIAPQLFYYFKQAYEQFPEPTKFLWKWGVKHPLTVPIMSLAGGFNINLTSIKDIEIYARGISTMNLDAFVTLFDQMLKYDASAILNKIAVPTLIVGGKQDTLTPQKHQNNLHSEIKNSQLQIIPYGSHCTQLDLPDFVNLRVEKFLKEIPY